MGIVEWIKSKFKKEEEIFVCPKCGCTDIAYFTVIANFVEVIRGTQDPKYIESAKCSRCGYREESKDGSHLKYFRK